MKYINTIKVVGILILSNKFPDLQKKAGGGRGSYARGKIRGPGCLSPLCKKINITPKIFVEIVKIVLKI